MARGRKKAPGTVYWAMWRKPQISLPLFDPADVKERNFSGGAQCSECACRIPDRGHGWSLGMRRAACSEACLSALLARGYAPHEEHWHKMMREWEAGIPTDDPMVRMSLRVV